MFKTKTVFVVGAGGSYELGLPLGDELKVRIAKKVNIEFDDISRLISGDNDIYEALKIHCNQEKSDFSEYRGCGVNMASALPIALSIDNYLDTHSSNEKSVLIGKIAIIQSILEAEQKSGIYTNPRDNRSFSISSVVNCWHNTFCQILTELSDKNDLEKIFENVAFITFNYDRCIEHYIALWLANYYHISEQEAQLLVNKMMIIHPYGKIGALPWEMVSAGQKTVPFGHKLNAKELLEAYNNIRTFTEKTSNEVEIEQIQKLLNEAQRIVYLGFSFGEMNMELMALKERNPIPKQIIATCVDMPEPNKFAKKALIDKSFLVNQVPGQQYIPLEAARCHDIMKNYYSVLSS
jgi:hypothetical protein